ncbi:hypothetical protein EVAR_27411_1 [Eumeta japonica]|uniref:Uncharacterized protein n=1 Tax=Eumeta variegata TaxID=151549 RepID=A0A4C1X2N8_EUMVA|nr:hypothetical protein EVAR_27411_1 [Eumeta japonica]
MKNGEVRFGNLNVCGGMDDKIDDVCELMKYRRLNISYVNETIRKCGAIKRGSFQTYWSDVEPANEDDAKDTLIYLDEKLQDQNFKDEYVERFKDSLGAFKKQAKNFFEYGEKARNNSKTSSIHVIKHDDVHLLNEENNVKWRWKNYDESVFACENTVADDNVTATKYMIEGGNESEITMDEVMIALKCMKIGKAVRYDRVSLEMLGGGGGTVASLFYQLLNKCRKRYLIIGVKQSLYHSGKKKRSRQRFSNRCLKMRRNGSSKEWYGSVCFAVDLSGALPCPPDE